MLFKHGLGFWAKDILTGFTGSITGRANYITGCNQYFLQPGLDEKDAFVEGRWFDEHRLEQQTPHTGAQHVLLATQGKGAEAVRPGGGPEAPRK